MGDQLHDEVAGEEFWEGIKKYVLNPIMKVYVAPPYPNSALTISFDPPEKVIRMAKGSDNWPITWGRDNIGYTAYGDGWGFHKDSDIKLSLGLATVSGAPPDVKGRNIYSRSGERVGQGKYGPKASGMLMVNDTLYMLVRNVDNFRLAWSADHGKRWKWTD